MTTIADLEACPVAAAGDEWVKTVRDRPAYRRFLLAELGRVVFEDWVTKPGIEQRVSRRAWRSWAKDASYRGNTPVKR